MAVSVAVAQPPAGFSNTYAAPQSLPAVQLTHWAPTTAVPASKETEIPSLSESAPSETVSLADSVMSIQPAIGLART